LKIHLFSHSGEKPYSCDFPNCPRSFSDKGNLKNHLKQHSQPSLFSEKNNNNVIQCESSGKLIIECSKLEILANMEESLQTEQEKHFGNNSITQQEKFLRDNFLNNITNSFE
jgi:uncharacterized Zn-finger protein